MFHILEPTSVKDSIPARYLLIEPNHNKVILDEYNFSRFNHSPFSGLDSSLPNSYSNNIIQVNYLKLTLYVLFILFIFCQSSFFFLNRDCITSFHFELGF